LESLEGFCTDLANAEWKSSEVRFRCAGAVETQSWRMVQGCRFEEGKGNTPDWLERTRIGKKKKKIFPESGWIGLALPEMFGGTRVAEIHAQPVNELAVPG